MKCIETALPGVKIVEPDVHQDSRGWFMESYTTKKFIPMGIDVVFVQDNHSYSKQKGVVRGLHFQNEPMAQSKLVRCTRGSVRDIVVDIRRGSSGFKSWAAFEISAENQRMLFIPKGFAHGFLTLEDDTEILYKVDNYYSKEHDRSIRYDDPELGIDWKIDEPKLSAKDMEAPTLDRSDCNFM